MTFFYNKKEKREGNNMGYRTLEISNAAEIHIKEGQLEVSTEAGVAFG